MDTASGMDPGQRFLCWDIYTTKIKKRRSPACFVTSFNKNTPAFTFQENGIGVGLLGSASLILATLILFCVLFSPPDQRPTREKLSMENSNRTPEAAFIQVLCTGESSGRER